MKTWPKNHLHGTDLQPVPYHRGQLLCAESDKRYVVMAAGTQGGKDVAIETLVATPDGMRQMRVLKVGDKVYTRSGKPTTITYVSPIFYDHECYKLVFDDGAEVIAGKDHQWLARNVTTGDKLTGEIVIRTEEIYTALLGGLHCSVDVAETIEGDESLLPPVHPYVLGRWLGSYNDSTASKFNQILQEDIRSLELINNKHIPEIYFNIKPALRRSLLAGILDKNGRALMNGDVFIDTLNEKLATDIARLASSIGAIARVEHRPVRKGVLRRQIGFSYRVIIRAAQPIAYQQYSDNYKTHIVYHAGRRTIVSIEKMPSVPTKCIAVDDPSHSYLITNSYIPTHNTTFGPHWLYDEIYDPVNGKGRGDYLAVTATYDLFKLKMLPSILDVLDGIHDVGRYWSGMKVIELRNPETGEYTAKRADDTMWGRIILRSADALSGLESSTAAAAWLDEVGQDVFTNNAYNAIRRRLALRRGRILMTTTLYSYNWFLTRIVKPTLATGTTEFIYSDIGDIDYTESDETNTTLVQFDSTVNPLFSQAEFAEAQNTLSEEEFSMFYRGREATRRFLIYNNFDVTKHTTKRFHIPETWARYVGVDFGGTHMAAVFYAEEPETKRLYAYKEYLAGNKTIKQHVADMLSEEPMLPVCYGGAKSEGQWRAEFSQAGLQVNKPSVSDVDVGIARVYAQHAVDGIIYFDDLSKIIEEKSSYRRKRLQNGDYSDEIMNKETYHMLDCERYIVSEIRLADNMRMKIRRLSLRK